MSAKGSARALVLVLAKGSAQRLAQGSARALVLVSARGSAQTLAQGSAQGLDQVSAQGSARALAQGSAQGSDQMSAKGSARALALVLARARRPRRRRTRKWSPNMRSWPCRPRHQNLGYRLRAASFVRYPLSRTQR